MYTWLVIALMWDTVILVGISLLCFNKRCTSQGEKECTSTLVPLYDGVYDTLIDNIDHDIDTLELGLDNYATGVKVRGKECTSHFSLFLYCKVAKFNAKLQGLL